MQNPRYYGAAANAFRSASAAWSAARFCCVTTASCAEVAGTACSEPVPGPCTPAGQSPLSVSSAAVQLAMSELPPSHRHLSSGQTPVEQIWRHQRSDEGAATALQLWTSLGTPAATGNCLSSSAGGSPSG